MIITVTNQKGGVGKTTTAQNLCAGLAKKGYKVLAVDLDPQTNFTYSTGINPKGTIADALKGERPIEECIETNNAYSIVSGDIKLTNIDAVIMGDNRESRLKTILEPIANQYDFIVIDTPPMLNTLTANALIASNSVIVPMNADVYSIQGLAQLKGMIDNAKKINKGLYIEGLLLTKYTLRTIINRHLKKQLESVAKQLDTKLFKATIRDATAVKEAQMLRTDLFSEYTKANVTKDYDAFIEELLMGINSDHENS